MLSYRRWQAVLAGRTPHPGLSLEGLNVHLFDSANPSRISRMRWKLHRALGTLPRFVAAGMTQERASLIHAHFGIDGVMAWPLARSLGLPLLVTLHGYDITTKRQWWESGQAGREMTQYPRRLLALAAQRDVHFISVSDAIRQFAVTFGIPREKVTTCYLGIDTQKFAPGPTPVTLRPRRVLFVGRLVEKKGCEYLLRAMQRVTQTIPGTELTVVGDGPLRGNLERLAAELGLAVRFLGSQPPERVRAELDMARVFCLPSIQAKSGDTEGLPISILEAQASGVPVVTSASGGATEGIEDGATGFAFPERDVQTLSDRLSALLQDDALAARFSRRAPEFIAGRFDIRACTQRLEHVYDKMAEAAGNT